MVLVKSSLPAAIVSSTSRLTAGIYALRPSSTTVVTPGPVQDNLKKPLKKRLSSRVTRLTAPRGLHTQQPEAELYDRDTLEPGGSKIQSAKNVQSTFFRFFIFTFI